MRNVLRISDAATLAFHALALLSEESSPVPVGRLSRPMHASEAHLSKVLQRLARAGLVTSVRGPRGGFLLERESADVSLLEVLEILDGPMEHTHSCLLNRPVCHTPDACPVRQLNEDVKTLVHERLSSLTLDDLDLSDLLPLPAAARG